MTAIAQAHWPLIEDTWHQLDWVESVSTMESWLDSYVGPEHWHYTTGTSVDHWLAVIEFERARDKTLFLLAWT